MEVMQRWSRVGVGGDSGWVRGRAQGLYAALQGRGQNTRRLCPPDVAIMEVVMGNEQSALAMDATTPGVSRTGESAAFASGHEASQPTANGAISVQVIGMASAVVHNSSVSNFPDAAGRVVECRGVGRDGHFGQEVRGRIGRAC